MDGMRIVNTILWDGYVASGNKTTAAMSLKHLEGFSVQATFTGTTPTGSLALQVSNDSAEYAAPTHWSTFAPTGFPVTVSAATTYVGNVTGCYYRWVRLVYTNSGTDYTMQLVVNGKGPGE